MDVKLTKYENNINYEVFIGVHVFTRKAKMMCFRGRLVNLFFN